jgi:hypothetical protein
MPQYQEPRTERTAEVDTEAGEILEWLGWTRIGPAEPEPEPEPEPTKAKSRSRGARVDDLIGE